MRDSSSSELLDELNSKQRKAILWPFVLMFGVVAFFLAAQRSLPAWTLVLIALAFLSLSVFSYYRDQLSKSVVLFYELDPSVEASYQALHDSFDVFRSCAACWRVEAEGSVHDQKYHAGASKLIKRKRIYPALGQPAYVKNNLTVPMLLAGQHRLCFFPDRLLVFAANAVGAISYDSLRIWASQTRFIEDGSVPHDAQVVDHTWRYVNKNGGPDRRFL